MNVNHRARSGGIIGINFFLFSLTRKFVGVLKNCLVEVILMSTHNIPFLI